jgi:hypothetical protein
LLQPSTPLLIGDLHVLEGYRLAVSQTQFGEAVAQGTVSRSEKPSRPNSAVKIRGRETKLGEFKQGMRGPVMPEGVELGDAMPGAAIGMHQDVAAFRRCIGDFDAFCCCRDDGRRGLSIPEVKAREEGDPLGVERPSILLILLRELFEGILVIAGNHLKGFYVGPSTSIPARISFLLVHIGVLSS